MKYKRIIAITDDKLERLDGSNNEIVIYNVGSRGINYKIGTDFKDKLCIKFDDIEKYASGTKMNGLHAKNIVHFLKKYESQCEKIIIACHDGDSVSGSVVMAIAKYYGLKIEQKFSNNNNKYISGLIDTAFYKEFNKFKYNNGYLQNVVG